jgi:hypothetical protein
MNPKPSVKTLARTLKYRELPELIGKTVKIHAPTTVEADVLAAIGDKLPEAIRLISPQEKYLERAMARHSILDLTFTGQDALLESQYESGIPLLKKFHFIGDPERAKELADELELDDPLCLGELNDDIERKETVIRLFLEAESIKGIGRHLIGELPPDYLPRDFTVTDACATNAGFVWFHKHFYL